jgi:hypothetical protein
VDQALAGFLLIGAPVVVLGALLVALARWSRRKNVELTTAAGVLKHADWVGALRRREFRTAVRLYFFGTLSREDERIGNALAVGVLVLVLTVLGAVAILILGSIAK